MKLMMPVQVLFLVLSSVPVNAAFEIRLGKVEYQEHPEGLDTPRPRFS